MSFHGWDIPCPECPKFGKNKDRQHLLEETDSNYSGTGEDVGTCPECGKSWWIGYEPVIRGRAEDWDDESREEREKRELEEKEREKERIEQEEKEMLKRLKEKYK